MKQFKLWLKEQHPDFNYRYGCHGCFDREKVGMERGWKAALQWMLDDLDYSIEHKEIGDKLDRELSDK